MENEIPNTVQIRNGESIDLDEIPVLPYEEFSQVVLSLLASDHNHCLNYYAFPNQGGLRFLCCIGDDQNQNIQLLSHSLGKGERQELEALSAVCFPLHIFEREIAENFGLRFRNHPWAKPLRYAFDRFDQSASMVDYPFYKIEGEELHEVGVGPIHAGVIEPGHFRFICNGENVLNLEIQLGWQHRGVENLFLEKGRLLQRHLLAESIAGDTAIGHNLAFALAMEALGGVEVNARLGAERAIALELERVAMHTADISALCLDTAYQLGASVFGALRTPLINFFQDWCGNRFGKGLVRTGGTNYPLGPELAGKLQAMLSDYFKRFDEVAERTYNLSSQQNRFDGIGTVSKRQVQMLGGVGMVARMADVPRDVRASHPTGWYRDHSYQPVTCPKGDVFARFLLRRLEVGRSVPLLQEIAASPEMAGPSTGPLTDGELKLAPNRLALSLTEGWRGEVCHCAVTDPDGKLMHYKVKDPSMHNWKALELSLRNLEISDFPINNKSYNLSYCGHDL